MAKSVTKKYGTGHLEDNCQLCYQPFGKLMYDCLWRVGLVWANMCHKCFVEQRCILGTGFGQKYKKDGKRWLKVSG